jgi:hypothetical protein
MPRSFFTGRNRDRAGQQQKLAVRRQFHSGNGSAAPRLKRLGVAGDMSGFPPCRTTPPPADQPRPRPHTTDLLHPDSTEIKP